MVDTGNKITIRD